MLAVFLPSHTPLHTHTIAQSTITRTSSSYSAAMLPPRKNCSGASASPRPPSLLFLFLFVALATALRVVPSMASTQRALALEACLEKGFNRETLKCSSCEKLAGAVGEKGEEGGREGRRRGAGVGGREGGTTRVYEHWRKA